MAAASKWKQPLHSSRRLLAKIWLRLHPEVNIIGVAGSYGKTSTTRMIAAVLSKEAGTLQTDINLDTIYNLPITLLKLRRHRFMVLEYGVDHRGEMLFHLDLVKPQVAVMTGITPVHTDPELLGSLKGVIREKGRLLEVLPRDGLAVLNADNQWVREMVKRTSARIVWYSLDSKKSDFWAEKIMVDVAGTSFVAKHRLANGKTETQKIKTGLVGRQFVEGCLAAVAIGRFYNLSWRRIQQALAELKPLSGRMSVEKGPRGTVLINDSLRANPASTAAGLVTLKEFPTKSRRVAVLGEMGELGEAAEASHREIGRVVAKLKIDFLIAVGPLQKLTARAAVKAGMSRQKVFWVEDVYGAAEKLKGILKKGDLLYLKGSLLRHMERVLMLLNGKKISCREVVCSFYYHCSDCQYLETGLNSK